MKKITREFLIFLKKPNTLDEKYKTGEKIKVLFKLYILSLILIFFVNIINKLLIYWELYDVPSHVITSWYNSNLSTGYYPVLITVLLLTIILEEITFRLLLTSYNIIYINLSLSFCLAIIAYLLFKNNLWQFNNSLVQIFKPTIYILSFSILFFPVIHLCLKYLIFLKNKWKILFRYIYYFSAILFAVYHIPSLNLNTKHYLFLPIIISPYFIYGLVLGYARIKIGFKYSILIHFIINLPVIYSIFT